MNPTNRYTQQVGLLTFVSGPLALLCLVLSGIALADHPDAFADPVQVLSIPHVDAALLRWSMLADMAGYYLLLLPVIFWLHQQLKRQTLWAPLITFCATAYVLIGAVGAVILAVITPMFLAEYSVAAPDSRTAVFLVYKTIIGIVYDGLWNTLETLLAGTWWLLTGVYLIHYGKAFRWTTLLLGILTLLDGLGEVLELETLAAIGLNGYLILTPVWAMWLGLLLRRSVRRAVPVPHQVELSV